jgi:hypothetical protein
MSGILLSAVFVVTALVVYFWLRGRRRTLRVLEAVEGKDVPPVSSDQLLVRIADSLTTIRAIMIFWTFIGVLSLLLDFLSYSG